MENIINKKYGRLIVLEKSNKQNKYKVYYYKCKCECGNEVFVLKSNLINGSTQSCGCYFKDFLKNNDYGKKELNEIEEKEDCIIIKIESKGKIYDCLIDKDDYPKIKNYRWILNCGGYAKNNNIFMHRIILEVKDKDKMIDHINHNILDNRKVNLRICTNQQNQMNKKSNGYCYSNKNKKLKSYIYLNNKNIHLGYYETKEEAINARRKAEEKYFGDFRYKEN